MYTKIHWLGWIESCAFPSNNINKRSVSTFCTAAEKIWLNLKATEKKPFANIKWANMYVKNIHNKLLDSIQIQFEQSSIHDIYRWSIFFFCSKCFVFFRYYIILYIWMSENEYGLSIRNTTSATKRTFLLKCNNILMRCVTSNFRFKWNICIDMFHIKYKFDVILHQNVGARCYIAIKMIFLFHL